VRLANAPQSVLARLIELDEHAKQLAAEADRLDARIAGLRGKGQGSGWNETIERELKAARQRADKAMHVASACKSFIDLLPPETKLEPVEVKLNGASLGSVREQLSRLQQQRRALINAAPSPSELSGEVKRWVEELAAQGKPSRLLTDNSFSPRWGGSAMTGPSVRPGDVLAFLAWYDGDRLAERMARELELQASDLQKLSRNERERRLVAIEHQIDELRYGEEQLLDGTERASDAPPAAVLGVKVVAPERAA
jgi:hypothetical protein